MATPENPLTPQEHTEAQPSAAPIGFAPPPFAEFERRTRVETAKTLSFWLIGILAGTILLHYGCIMLLILTGHEYGIKTIEDVLHLWLPVLSGLAGAAGTLYFTRERS